ncbi:hypothetical protein Tco_0643500 [Tanacetum coccineum]
MRYVHSDSSYTIGVHGGHKRSPSRDLEYIYGLLTYSVGTDNSCCETSHTHTHSMVYFGRLRQGSQYLSVEGGGDELFLSSDAPRSGRGRQDGLVGWGGNCVSLFRDILSVLVGVLFDEDVCSGSKGYRGAEVFGGCVYRDSQNGRNLEFMDVWQTGVIVLSGGFTVSDTQGGTSMWGDSVVRVLNFSRGKSFTQRQIALSGGTLRGQVGWLVIRLVSSGVCVDEVDVHSCQICEHTLIASGEFDEELYRGSGGVTSDHLGSVEILLTMWGWIVGRGRNFDGLSVWAKEKKGCTVLVECGNKVILERLLGGVMNKGLSTHTCDMVSHGGVNEEVIERMDGHFNDVVHHGGELFVDNGGELLMVGSIRTVGFSYMVLHVMFIDDFAILEGISVLWGLDLEGVEAGGVWRYGTEVDVRVIGAEDIAGWEVWKGRVECPWGVIGGVGVVLGG